MARAQKPKKKGKRLPIRACPVCGSRELGAVEGGVNTPFIETTALSGLVRCKACSQFVLPIELPSEEARQQFAAAQAESKQKGVGLPVVKRRFGFAAIGLCAFLSIAAFAAFIATGSLPALGLSFFIGAYGAYLIFTFQETG